MRLISLSEDVSVRQPFLGDKSQVIVNNKILKRGPSFSKTQKEAAITWCKKYYTHNGLSLIVESKLHLTVWFECLPQETQPKDNPIIHESENATPKEKKPRLSFNFRRKER